MNTYNCKFIGRENGAIGISSYCEKTLQADSADQAHLKLYDTHEDIMKFQITNTSNPIDFKSSKRND
jgi:hypothetical protein